MTAVSKKCPQLCRVLHAEGTLLSGNSPIPCGTVCVKVLLQTETILKGQSVSGMAIDDLMQVKNYGDGSRQLTSMFEDKAYALDGKTTCALHNLVGREDALTWGAFLNSQVNILEVDYNPPHCDLLPDLAARGFAFLGDSVASPEKRAFATFLFMTRSQFFHDANKRTASLMMNGLLLQNALFPAIVRNSNSEEFHVTLRQFYNSGDATPMMGFFAKATQELYPQQIAAPGSAEQAAP